MNKFGNFLWGIVLIGIGVILGGNAIGIFDINIFFNGWWTLFIIVPTFIGLFKEKDKTGNIIGLLIGVLLLLSCRDLLDFGMLVKLIFPIILVIIGVSVIFKDTFNNAITKRIRELNNNNKSDNEYCATFSGQDLKFDDQEFKGANLTAVFGGVKCDITKAIIKEDQVINCSSIFGGIDILVPDNINVKIKSSSIFGGVSNDKHTSQIDGAKNIYINAKCIFGGVDIK